MSEETKAPETTIEEPQQPESTQAETDAANDSEPEDAKTLTQAEIDAMITKAKNQTRRQYFTDAEEEKAWKAWKAAQEAQKPEEQKLAEITRKLVAKEQELETYQRKDEAIKAGIDAKYLDFAVFEIGKSIQEGEAFSDAMARWISANEFVKAGEEPEKPAPTGMRHRQSGRQIDGVEAAFRAKNPNLKLD